jgi:hypothetical protein
VSETADAHHGRVPGVAHAWTHLDDGDDFDLYYYDLFNDLNHHYLPTELKTECGGDLALPAPERQG